MKSLEQLLCFKAMMQLNGFKIFTKDKLILKIGLFSTSSLEKKMFSFPQSVNLAVRKCHWDTFYSNLGSRNSCTNHKMNFPPFNLTFKSMGIFETKYEADTLWSPTWRRVTHNHDNSFRGRYCGHRHWKQWGKVSYDTISKALLELSTCLQTEKQIDTKAQGLWKREKNVLERWYGGHYSFMN